MRWILTLVFAALLAGCAGPGGRDSSDRDRERAREDRLERQRMCDIYAREGRRDPECGYYPAPADPGPGVGLPPVKGPRL